jgi:hypothetical protein
MLLAGSILSPAASAARRHASAWARRRAAVRVHTRRLAATVPGNNTTPAVIRRRAAGAAARREPPAAHHALGLATSTEASRSPDAAAARPGARAAESDAEESEVWTAWPLRDLPSHLLLAAGVTSFWRGAWYVLDVAVFPDSALLSGGATLGLGWGGFALLRKFAGSSHQPPPRPESLAPSFCLRWQSNLRYPPPAPARRELRWSLSVSARPPRLRRLRARAGHHGAPRGGRVQPSAAHLRRVSHRALGSLLLAGGLGALGRAIRGDERRARRAGLGSHLALRRGGCVNSRRSFHSNARPARTDRDASRLEASGAVR